MLLSLKEFDPFEGQVDLKIQTSNFPLPLGPLGERGQPQSTPILRCFAVSGEYQNAENQ